MATRFILRSSALVLAATVAAALSGCATSLSSSGGSATPVALAAGQFGGRVHGGNQPIIGAAVTLWAAGSSAAGGAYGKGATSVATGTTDLNGNFTFNNASGVSPCTPGQYLYVTAVGGNTGAGANPYSALMAALPTPCVAGAAGTGATFIWINEVTTVAAVWSLQQFMSINPSATGTTPPWQIGAPASNVIGMGNAFAQTAQLASIANGVSQASAPTNTVGGVVYTTTILPDVSRINTLADILAACVNTPGTAVCTSLFSDTTPTGSTAPGDTIQAAYYLATNPAGLTMNAHSAVNSPTYLCNTYVTAAGTPFLPTLTCGTNNYDWLIGVNWKAVNGTTAAVVGTIYAASVAIDGFGNIWVGAGTGVAAGGAMVTEFNQSGQVLQTPISQVNIPAYNVNYIATSVATSLAYAGTGSTPIPLGYARPFSIAIDTNNNAWFDSYAAVSPGALTSGSTTLQTGVLVEVTQAGVATGFIAPSNPGALALDGYNNIYMNGIPLSGEYYFTEVESGAQKGETGVPYQTIDQGSGRGSKIYNGVMVDGSLNEYAWGFSSSTTCGTATAPVTIDRTDTTLQESNPLTGASSASITDSVGCSTYGVPDAAANAWVTASPNLYYLNVGSSASSTGTTFTGGTASTATGNGGIGGLDNAGGVAIDGAGTVWVLNRVVANSTTNITGLTALVPSTTNGVTTVTALSPGGSAATQVGQYGFQTFGTAGGQGVQIDSSGNLWFNTTGGSYLYHMVGAAVPVATPLALQVLNTVNNYSTGGTTGGIGERP